jgi:Zn finger protein HypA/HybF involved in hydrogenase expression
MMICRDCKGTKIKSRQNYSHGKKSKPSIKLVCKKCNSSNIEVTTSRQRRNYARK